MEQNQMTQFQIDCNSAFIQLVQKQPHVFALTWKHMEPPQLKHV